jgi:uncharacterized protein YbdZ (MbtH family)
VDPFDDPHAEVRVAVDCHGCLSLWPVDVPVPFGWAIALCPAPRHEAQAYLDRHHSMSALDADAR